MFLNAQRNIQGGSFIHYETRSNADLQVQQVIKMGVCKSEHRPVCKLQQQDLSEWQRSDTAHRDTQVNP